MNGSGLSDAHAILLAVQLSINGDITPLPALQAQFHHVLTLDLLLRIVLTFLPESVAPARYTSVVQSLADGSALSPLPETPADTSAIKELTAGEAKKRVRRLRLLPLRHPDLRDDNDNLHDPLAQFLLHRAHRIDTESGIQPLILELLEPFLSTSDSIRKFVVSTVLPLLRFNYEYHPDKDETLSLQLIRSLDSGSSVNLFLSKTERREDGGDVARDLRGLVGPWMYGHARSKRRKLSEEGPQQQLDPKSPSSGSCGWQDVNEWLLSVSLRDFTLLVEAIEGWDGPEDVDLGGFDDQDEPFPVDGQAQLRQRYGQAALAAVYATSVTATDVWSGSCRILSKIASFLGFHIHSSPNKSNNDDLSSMTFDFPSFFDTPRGLLFHNALLEPSNPFTTPTPESVAFMDAILLSIRTLDGLGRAVSPRDVAELCLFANDESQLFEFHATLETLAHGSGQSRNWSVIRQELLWLRDWTGTREPGKAKPGNARGIFWHIQLDHFEREILKAMLNAKQYNLAVELYANSLDSPPLLRDQVEAAVKEAIFVAYDNATNGNKTRGGIKRASEMLESFSPHFPQSTSFHQIKSLISATHALSFYSLTLQHGVPFQPVSIRVHHDPLSLIEKVLEQNPKAYTELDNLLIITRHLVSTGLKCISKEYEAGPYQSISPEHTALIAERRIISHAISSALQADDFDTAYSYVLTHLTPPSLISSAVDSLSFDDRISWRAAYNAGKYRSSLPEQPNRTLQSQISHLSKRMELLSLALILSPSSDYLPEILAVWRRCDEEMTVLQTREFEEAEQWDAQGDQSIMSSTGATTTLPGGFGPSDRELDALETAEKRARRSHAARIRRKGAYEEAPVGLFDAARGAARAISKNAFQLRDTAAAPASSSSRPSAMSDASGGDMAGSRSSFDTGGEDGESMDGRVRKRDMVSNMVTGGLASGIGWVLGAQPVNTNAGREGT